MRQAGNIKANRLDRGYLTDGTALFHVERTLLDDPRGELLVELGHCATLSDPCARRSRWSSWACAPCSR